MGEAPLHLSFIDGAGSFRASFALSGIYYEEGAYDEAYNYCLRSLREKSDFLPAFYKISQILIKKNLEIKAIKLHLESFFGIKLDDLAYLALSDIFMKEGKHDIAYEYLVKADALEGETSYIAYLKGLNLLYQKEIDEALECFKRVNSEYLDEKTVYNIALCYILKGQSIESNKVFNIINKKFKGSITGVL